MIIERIGKMEDTMIFTAAEAEELGAFKETALTEGRDQHGKRSKQNQ